MLFFFFDFFDAHGFVWLISLVEDMKNILQLTQSNVKAQFHRLLINGGPGDLFGHSAVCDSGARMIVFGGSDPQGKFPGEVWMLNIEENSWKCIGADAGFSGRQFHSAIMYDGNMWVFGGLSNSIHQDLAVFDCSLLKWKMIASLGQVPSPRYGHCSVVHNDILYVFGGHDKNGFACNDLYEFHFSQLSWEKPLIRGIVPKEVYHHSAVVHEGSMYIFGGYRKNYNEISEYRFATKSWSFLQTSGNAPMPRWGHVAAVHGKSMYIIGGRDRVSNFSDCFCLNFETNVWKKIDCEGVDGRFFSSVIIFNDSLYVFGGRNIHSFCFNDTLKHSLKDWDMSVDDSLVRAFQIIFFR